MHGIDVHGGQPRYTLYDLFFANEHQTSGGNWSSLPHHLDGLTLWNNKVKVSNAYNLWNPDGYRWTVTQASIIGYKCNNSPITGAYVENYGQTVTPNSLYEGQLARRSDVHSLWTDAAKVKQGRWVQELEGNSINTRTQAVQDAIVKAVQLRDPTVINPSHVMQSDLSKITKLVVSDAGMKTLKDGDFQGLSNLKQLWLSGNELTALTRQYFTPLANLEDLEVIDNNLASLPASVFFDLPNLKYLDLGGNVLTSLPTNIFRRSSNLIDLNLDYNSLDRLPNRIFDGLSNLKHLNLAQRDWGSLVVNVRIAGNSTDGFTVVVPTHAPFQMDMEVSVEGALFYDRVRTTKTMSVSIKQGAYESKAFLLVKDENEQGAIFTLDIKQLPDLPQIDTQYHWGYTIEKQGVPVSFPIASLPKNPLNTKVLANFPNPFNPETWIPYQLEEPSNVVITIYDLRGRTVRELNLGHQHTGFYLRKNRAAHWDGKNDVGESVASGVYFYNFETGSLSILRKMVIRK